MEAITKEGTQNEVHVTDMRSAIDPVTPFGKPAFSADWYGLLIAGGKNDIFKRWESGSHSSALAACAASSGLRGKQGWMSADWELISFFLVQKSISFPEGHNLLAHRGPDDHWLFTRIRLRHGRQWGKCYSLKAYFPTPWVLFFLVSHTSMAIEKLAKRLILEDRLKESQFLLDLPLKDTRWQRAEDSVTGPSYIISVIQLIFI